MHPSNLFQFLLDDRREANERVRRAALRRLDKELRKLVCSVGQTHHDTDRRKSLLFLFNHYNWGWHAHYGWFQELAEIQKIWLTVTPGTYGDQTEIEIELSPWGRNTPPRIVITDPTRSIFENSKKNRVF